MLLVAFVLRASASAELPWTVEAVEPPHLNFYSKKLVAHGVTIWAPPEVHDRALLGMAKKLDLLLENLSPKILQRMREKRVSMRIYGRHQVPSDLPEMRHQKNKRFTLAEFGRRASWMAAPGAKTFDQVVAGQAGPDGFCPETSAETGDVIDEDACLHELAHQLHIYGLSWETAELIDRTYERALASNRFGDTYSGVDSHEFFAELTVWYLGGSGGTHGFHPTAEPESGPAWLRWYDPDSFALIEALYSGAEKLPRPPYVPLFDVAAAQGQAFHKHFVAAKKALLAKDGEAAMAAGIQMLEEAKALGATSDSDEYFPAELVYVSAFEKIFLAAQVLGDPVTEWRACRKHLLAQVRAYQKLDWVSYKDYNGLALELVEAGQTAKLIARRQGKEDQIPKIEAALRRVLVARHQRFLDVTPGTKAERVPRGETIIQIRRIGDRTVSTVLEGL